MNDFRIMLTLWPFYPLEVLLVTLGHRTHQMLVLFSFVCMLQPQALHHCHPFFFPSSSWEAHITPNISSYPDASVTGCCFISSLQPGAIQKEILSLVRFQHAFGLSDRVLDLQCDLTLLNNQSLVWGAMFYT